MDTSKSCRNLAIACALGSVLILAPAAESEPPTSPAGAVTRAQDAGIAERDSESAAKFRDLIHPVFQRFCIDCHGSDPSDVAGDLDLSQLSQPDLENQIELLSALVDVLDHGDMPPEDQPQPAETVRRQLREEFSALLRRAIEQQDTFPPIPIRRMNRFQYNNAVTDLFDLRCEVFTLPERMMREHNGYFQPGSGKMPDLVRVGSRPLGKSQMIEPRLAGVAAFPQDLRAENGFDNRGDHLSMSPLLMESFLKLGDSITQSPDFIPRNVGIWKVFFKAPRADQDASAEAKRRLRPFLTRAFRRPIDDDLLDRYASYASHKLDQGEGFTEVMKEVAAAAIASPRFLYLYETSNQSEGNEAIDDFELASRLSFFLWGSLPDSTLLDLAATNSLSQPDVLHAEIDRMLCDHKLKRFCDSFPSQWLQLERIISSVPNPDKFPGFYFLKYRDSMHMMLEPLLLFETVLIENRPITELIDSSFSYRSDLLEEAYGELRADGNAAARAGGDPVTVLNFKRVPISDRRTGGVITNAAVMTMTSGPERTQPITRGAWIASVIFNDPPEPPPADVPPLNEKPSEAEKSLTLRERLELHRQRADCKGCHERIDPLGFALENYDPVGRWREQYENGRKIDPSGKLFRHHEFCNVVEFKDAILDQKDRFTHALASHLLSFALARELAAADQPALDKIVEATASDDDRIQTLLKQVILSDPFRSKSNPKASEATVEERAEK